MKANMSSFDRVFRIIVAVAIVILYFTNAISGSLGIILLVAAGVFLLTSITGSCPLYSLFGVSTCKAKINQ